MRFYSSGATNKQDADVCEQGNPRTIVEVLQSLSQIFFILPATVYLDGHTVTELQYMSMERREKDEALESVSEDALQEQFSAMEPAELKKRCKMYTQQSEHVATRMLLYDPTITCWIS